jgi:hypothetical protein
MYQLQFVRSRLSGRATPKNTTKNKNKKKEISKAKTKISSHPPSRPRGGSVAAPNLVKRPRSVGRLCAKFTVKGESGSGAAPLRRRSPNLLGAHRQIKSWFRLPSSSSVFVFGVVKISHTPLRPGALGLDIGWRGRCEFVKNRES